MALSDDLIQEFTSVMADTKEGPKETTCYGTARIIRNETTGEEETFVVLDGSDISTPATYTVAAHSGDRVMAILKSRRAIVIGNITNPVLIVGTLKANDKVVILGSLTTNEARSRYNDTQNNGLTFDSEGIGAHSNNGSWWMKADGTFQIGGENGIIYSNNKVRFGSDVVLTWGSISGKPENIATTDDIPDGIITTSNYTGTITKTYIDSLNVVAENISGTTLTGKTISGGEIKIGTPSNNVYPFQVASNGFMTSTSGKIAGWDIGATALSSTSGGKITGMQNQGSGTWAFTAGATSMSDWSTGPFRVSHSGELYATNAHITGAITATSLTLGSGVQIPASTGVSGLATVATTGTYSSLTGRPDLTVYIAKDGTVGSTPAAGVNGFKVASSGALTASNVIVYGTIYASNGTIAGWTIGANKLTKGTLGANDSIHLGTANLGTATIADKNLSTWRLTVGSGFGVDVNGILYAKGANISGVLNAGANSIIGPWNVTASSIWYGNATYQNANGLYFGTSGLSIKDKFYVTSAGIPYCMGADLYLCRASIASGNGARLRFRLGNDEYGSIGIDGVGTVDQGVYLDSPYGGIYLNSYLYCKEAVYFTKNAGGVFASKTLSSWVSSMSHPAVDVDNDGNSNSGAITAVIMKSKNGRLAIGSYPSSDDRLYFSYITEANYATATNSVSQIYFDLPNRTITAATFIGALTGHASSDLAITGGTLTGNLTMSNNTNVICGSSGSAYGQYVKVWNNKHQGSLYADTSGNLGIYSDTTGRWAIRIASDGVVYARTAHAPSNTNVYRIVGSSDTDGIRVSLLRYGYTAGKFEIYSQTGTAGSSYSWRTPTESDISLKENVKKSNVDSLSILNKVNLYEFDWKTTNEHWNIGFIANEIGNADPNLAYVPKTDDETYSINTFYMQGHIVKAIQQLTGRIKELEAEIKELKGAA